MSKIKKLFKSIFKKDSKTKVESKDPVDTKVDAIMESKPEPDITFKEVIQVQEPEIMSKNYKDLPLPNRDGSMEAAAPLIKEVSKITGVDPKSLALIIDLESSFRTSVKAPTSSATGWFQFINRTYQTMLARHYKEYHIPNGRDLRVDPRVSALLGAELTKENTNILKNVLKRQPTMLEIYMAHFLGAGVARKFLALSDDTVVANVLPREAQANRWVFYDSKGKARTVKEVKDSIATRTENSRKNVNKYFA